MILQVCADERTEIFLDCSAEVCSLITDIGAVCGPVGRTEEQMGFPVIGIVVSENIFNELRRVLTLFSAPEAQAETDARHSDIIQAEHCQKILFIVRQHRQLSAAAADIIQQIQLLAKEFPERITELRFNLVKNIFSVVHFSIPDHVHKFREQVF